MSKRRLMSPSIPYFRLLKIRMSVIKTLIYLYLYIQIPIQCIHLRSPPKVMPREYIFSNTSSRQQIYMDMDGSRSMIVYVCS